MEGIIAIIVFSTPILFVVFQIVEIWTEIIILIVFLTTLDTKPENRIEK